MAHRPRPYKAKVEATPPSVLGSSPAKGSVSTPPRANGMGCLSLVRVSTPTVQDADFYTNAQPSSAKGRVTHVYFRTFGSARPLDWYIAMAFGMVCNVMSYMSRATRKILDALYSIPSAVPGVAAGAAIMAYLATPYVPFLPPWTIGAGIWTALSAAALYAAVGQEDLAKIAAQAALGIIGMLALMEGLSQAERERAVNDRRCLAIQRDMLSARPRRDDGPDLFQALGCRPQGEGSVYAPRSAR